MYTKKTWKESKGYDLTLMIQPFVTVEIITILCFMARQQLTALQSWQWEIPSNRGNWNACKRPTYHMPISANKDKSICQIPWKRWKKFQGNESLVQLIHTSWIKVVSCNLKKYLVSELKFLLPEGLHVLLPSTRLVCMTWGFEDFPHNEK